MTKRVCVPREMPLSERILLFSTPVTECGCWLWDRSTTPKGYPQLTYHKKHYEGHRASWIAFRGPIPDGLFVCHKCNVPLCVNPDHLYLGTSFDNCADRKAAGTQIDPPRLLGSEHPMARLTEDDVRAIRKRCRGRRLRNGESKEIAEQYGVSINTIYAIRSRKIWGWLQ